MNCLANFTQLVIKETVKESEFLSCSLDLRQNLYSFVE